MHFENAVRAKDARITLDGAEISTHRIVALTRRPDPEDRWSKGFGPDGGNKDRGKTVVLQGLPSRTSIATFTEALRGARYQLNEDHKNKAVEVVSAGG